MIRLSDATPILPRSLPLAPDTGQRTLSFSRPMFGRMLRQLGFQTYKDYLASSHWRRVRRAYRSSELEQSCYCCGESETDLHHKTYERLGQEVLSDLVPLCKRCHVLVHVLERRGDLTLDLAGLLDATRAAQTAEIQTQRRARAEAEFEEAHDPTEPLVRSLCIRLKNFGNDADELHSIIEGVGELENLTRARLGRAA